MLNLRPMAASPHPTSSRLACAFLLLLVYAAFSAQAQPVTPPASFPYPEKLTYRVEWRMIMAGTATVQLSKSGPQGWLLDMNLESAGLVNRLFKVLDTYKVTTAPGFCGASALLDAQEGKKHTISKLIFDNSRHRIMYNERDLVRNTSTDKELDSAPCTYEILGALAALRTANLEPGKSITVPITDGKKSASVRIRAESKENITFAGKAYSTTRYEAFVFDNVLYKRRGRLLVWVADDPGHLPLQFRLLMGFPIGTVTVELQKQEKF